MTGRANAHGVDLNRSLPLPFCLSQQFTGFRNFPDLDQVYYYMEEQGLPYYDHRSRPTIRLFIY